MNLQQLSQNVLLNTDCINQMAYDHHGKMLAICSDDQIIKIWSLSQQRCLETLPFCADINAIARDFPYYVGIRDKKTVIANRKNQEVLAVFPFSMRNASLSSNGVLSGHAGEQPQCRFQ